MSRVVKWTDRALDQLAELYVDTPAAERDELADVVLRIERELAVRGEIAGESRGNDDDRVYMAPRLTVLYRLMPDSRIQIYRVRPSRRRWKDEGRG